MVLTRFSWPHGGRQVFLCGSFSRWMEHHPMNPIEGSTTFFQTICNLPPGLHQYRFLVDGVWRIDNQQAFLPDDNGAINNGIYIEEPDVSAYIPRIMDMDDGVPLHLASPYSRLPPDQVDWVSGIEIESSRRWVSRLLSSQTIYDIMSISSKITIIDVQLPVKQAFHLMFEEGLPIVPLWDDLRSNITGMLTATDFILILRELESNAHMLANEELEMHSVSAWKGGKLQLHRKCNGPVATHERPLINVSAVDSLKDVALKIVQHEISTVPVFESVLREGSNMSLLNLASLPQILKYICSNLTEPFGTVPYLQHPISRIPLGTWLAGIGRGNGRQLVVVRRDASLRSALDLLLEAKISSLPVVDDNGSLIDVYSRSDIIALAKGNTYARVQLGQVTMEQALDQVNQVNFHSNGHRQYRTCLRSTSFREIIEQLSDPGVRRLVFVEARSRRVEGIISLRDVFMFLLG